MADLAPVVFDAPLVNPAPIGLITATAWTDEEGPLRWLAKGVDVRVFNYGGEDAYGVWAASWLASQSDLDEEVNVKIGERPEDPDTYLPMTSWAYDQGNLMKYSQDEVRKRAEQVHRLQEPNGVEAHVATRLLADTTASSVADIVEAVSKLELELAKTSTVGMIHAGAQWAAKAAAAQLVRVSGTKLVTPLGHTWVFGGGYATALGDELVATSPTYGWRGPVDVRDAVNTEHNQFIAIAERSLVVGYEAAVAAVDIG